MAGNRKPIIPRSLPWLRADPTEDGRDDTMATRATKALRGPKIVTVPPGPKSKAALARKEKFITNGVKVALPIDVTAAEGPFVQDADGNVYVDLGGGIGVQTAGHRPPSVVRGSLPQQTGGNEKVGAAYSSSLFYLASCRFSASAYLF